MPTPPAPATGNDAPTLEVRALRGPAPGRLPLLESRQIFCQGSAVRIAHAGQIYQLRVTRENKLILTK